MFVRPRIQHRHWIRRSISLLVVLGICASLVPLPIPLLPAQKDHSAPFPCQDRPCGCQSAEQCWQGCCCFSNSEKLAWARENEVTPPAYVVEAAREEALVEVATVTSTKNSASCCSRKHLTETTATTDAMCAASEPTASCCDHDHSSTSDRSCDHDSSMVEIDAESGAQFVVITAYRRCQGQGLYWNALPWTTLEPLSSFTLDPEPFRWQRPASSSFCSLAGEPPEPPPRLVIAATVVL